MVNLNKNRRLKKTSQKGESCKNYNLIVICSLNWGFWKKKLAHDRDISKQHAKKGSEKNYKKKREF